MTDKYMHMMVIGVVCCISRQLQPNDWSLQGIINCKGTKTFAKEPKLAKLLRELKPTLVSYNKKIPLVLSHVCNDKFSAFWMLFCGMTCKWVLFPTIDLLFY